MSPNSSEPMREAAGGGVSVPRQSAAATSPSQAVAVGVAWLAVGAPLAWGVSQTLIKAMALFQ